MKELRLITVLLIINLVFLLFVGFRVTGFFISEGVKGPYDFISEEQISSNSTMVFFEAENASFKRFTDSGSMDPLFGETSTGVSIKPISEDDIHVGDIVSFTKDEIPIAHRVVEKGVDSGGVYFITQGDNNYAADGKIRFFDIDSVIIAVIY